MRVFRDEDGEYLFDTHSDMFDSDDAVGGALPYCRMEMMMKMI
jgi:hypothetical protein